MIWNLILLESILLFKGVGKVKKFLEQTESMVESISPREVSNWGKGGGWGLPEKNLVFTKMFARLIFVYFANVRGGGAATLQKLLACTLMVKPHACFNCRKIANVLRSQRKTTSVDLQNIFSCAEATFTVWKIHILPLKKFFSEETDVKYI